MLPKQHTRYYYNFQDRPIVTGFYWIRREDTTHVGTDDTCLKDSEHNHRYYLIFANYDSPDKNYYKFFGYSENHYNFDNLKKYEFSGPLCPL